MGMIMSTGVSVANAILIVTNAERLRLEYRDATRAAITSASIRLRPILMTSLAMIAGMIPMASGMGEAGEQTAPLGPRGYRRLICLNLCRFIYIADGICLGAEQNTYDSPSLMPEESTETNL